VSIYVLLRDVIDDKAGLSAAVIAANAIKLTAIADSVAADAKTWLDTRPVTVF